MALMRSSMMKKKVLIALATLILVGTVGVVIYYFAQPEKLDQRQELENDLKEMGTNFYVKLYNDLGGDLKKKEAFLEKYSKIGIKSSLSNLERNDREHNAEIVAKFVNEKTKEACDKEKTQVILYPKKPYGENDFDIEVTLVCGFDEEESE